MTIDRVMITGGAGFIGSHLTRRLAESGREVIVYDNFSTGRISNLGTALGASGVKIVTGDLLDRELLGESMDGCKLVFHLAASRDVRIGIRDTETDIKQNLTATHNLLNCLKESRTCRRLIFTSTSTVYGEPAEMPTPETYGPLRPLSLYGASKLACEGLISAYNHLFGISAIILRLANITGPGSDHGVVSDLIHKMLLDSSGLVVLGNGKQRKSYLHVDDCIDAMQMLIEEEFAEAEIFNIGSSDSISVKEIADSVKRLLGTEDTPTTYEHNGDGRGWAGDVREMLLNCEKLAAFGWSPKHTSAEAIESAAKALADPTSSNSSQWRVPELVRVRSEPNTN